MKKLIVLGTAGALAAIVMACGGGGTSSADKSSTAAAAKPAATVAATKAAPTAAANTPAASGTSESTPTTAELSAYITQLKQIMTAVIAKAQAGDIQGTRDTEGTMDTAMEATVKATRAVDPALADKLENLELDIEHQADATNTDLSVIIKDAQAVPAVLDQVATALKLTPAAASSSPESGAAPTTAQLSDYVKQLKQIMGQVIAKAQAGDVQGTRDTEGTMDTAMEATVKATRAVDPALADKLENLELDIEHQADASTTDLSIIIKDCQAVLPILDQVVTTLKLTP